MVLQTVQPNDQASIYIYIIPLVQYLFFCEGGGGGGGGAREPIGGTHEGIVFEALPHTRSPSTRDGGGLSCLLSSRFELESAGDSLKTTKLVLLRSFHVGWRPWVSGAHRPVAIVGSSASSSRGWPSRYTNSDAPLTSCGSSNKTESCSKQ